MDQSYVISEIFSMVIFLRERKKKERKKAQLTVHTQSMEQLQICQ